MCVYREVSPTSQIRAEVFSFFFFCAWTEVLRIRAEVRMKNGHSVWAKYREASEVIDLHELFSDYWTSNNDKFTVLSQSFLPPGPQI